MVKLLFDENISFRIVKRLFDFFPGSVHVSDVLTKPISDDGIFDYARIHNFCIVTFDSDFQMLQALRGFPPKIVWLRSGNTSTLNIANSLISHVDQIQAFAEGAEFGTIEIY
jgi:predicted nuclease of predicted toxin-antitoxin system